MAIKTKMKKALKIFFIFLAAIAAIYVVLVIIRMFHFYNLDKTNEQVAKIHNTKLTMDDVMGKNLPNDPGAEADKTIQGIDANKNGIRDDVEVAIFKEYPNSAKTRAALLQYALALQMEAVQKVVNKEVVIATAEKESSGYDCIGNIVPKSENDLEEIDTYINFLENKQFNTISRKKYHIDFNKHIGSFELQRGCDIDLNKLSN